LTSFRNHTDSSTTVLTYWFWGPCSTKSHKSRSRRKLLNMKDSWKRYRRLAS